MMNAILFAGLLGGFGGIVRASVGLSKSIAIKKKIRFDYWITTGVLALFIGMFVGMLFSFDFRFSLLAGYAGTDIIEGIYKTFNSGKGFVAVK